MEFTGLHHITMITGDAQRNARYYGDLLGLRLVKKTVNFDQPQAYHLYFGDESGTPGSIPATRRCAQPTRRSPPSTRSPACTACAPTRSSPGSRTPS